MATAVGFALSSPPASAQDGSITERRAAALTKTVSLLEEKIDSLQGELLELLSGEKTEETTASIERKRIEVVEIRARLKSVKSELAQVEAAQADQMRQLEVAKLRQAVASRDAQVQALSDQLATMERERETPAGNAELRVFPLKYLDARSASMTVGEIVGGQGVRSSVDVRTNALIISAPPEKLEVIRSLLEILDVENRDGANAEAGQGPRSLLVRVFWLADNLPEGEGQDPAKYLPGSVLKAVQGVGLESPRIVSQVVNSAVNVMGDGQSPPFLSSTSVLVGGRNAKEVCSGTLRVAGDREVVLQLSVQVEDACQVEGNLTMPIGHYMVLGTANEVTGHSRPSGEDVDIEYRTSRFAFVVQVVEAESFAPEE